MNRFFAITGFLAVGLCFLWIWFLIVIPWIPAYSSVPSAIPIWFWPLWGVACLIGLSVAFAFVRCSLKGHWTALRDNTPLSSSAWRGVCGAYLLTALACALPLLSGDPSGSHTTELYLYSGLAICGLALGALAGKRGFCKVQHPPSS